MSSKFDRHWPELFEAAMTEVAEWREQHSKATFNEIEDKLDRRLSQVRAQLLQDLVHRSPNADLRGSRAEERPVCPECGEPLAANGQHRRELTTFYEQRVTITRSYGRCPECGGGFFPPG
jgi:ribosomal protein L34E